MRGAYLLLSGATTVAELATMRLGAASKAATAAMMLNPYVLGIMAVATAVYLLWKYWDQVTAAVRKAYTEMKSFFSSDQVPDSIKVHMNSNVVPSRNDISNQANYLPLNMKSGAAAASTSTTVHNNDNRTMHFNIAPNSSENQAKEIQQHIDNYGRSQNRQSLAIAGSGFR